MRTDAGERQTRGRADCGVYAMTHALYLAYGYGLNAQRGTFASGHQDKMLDRRYRIVQELASHCIYESKSSNKAPPGTRLCDYPILDSVPSSSPSQGWKPIDSIALSELSSGVRNRRSCYAECSEQETLQKHCQRNSRFYPGYDNVYLNPNNGLREFREWVEMMDECRRLRSYQHSRHRPLPFPGNKPRAWVSPKGRGKVYPALW